jgi:RNA polymerase sigma-70 factor (ECF subfamily)
LSGTDEQLLSRALAGDAAAFGTLVRSYQGSVYSLALRMLSDRQKAEDLAQEVFLRLYRNLASIGSLEHLSFWLRKVTVNGAIDRLRRDTRYEAVPLAEADDLASETAEKDPLLERRLRSLLAKLAPAARAVLLLRYQEDLEPADIARTLSMSINTVKSHLKRSLAMLRECIGESVI